MKLLNGLLKRIRGASSHGINASKFQKFEFSGERFECTLNALSRSGACEELFLNSYDTTEVRKFLGASGMTAHLNSLGFDRLHIVSDKDENAIHTMRVFDRKPAPDRRLIELRLSEIIYTPNARLTAGIIPERRYNLIAIEWLNLQNPRAAFTDLKPRLPGQEYPGLGCVRQIAHLLEMFAGDVSAAGIMDVPERFHDAVMYSRRFRFMDPAREGLMRAALRDLAGHTLADISWGFITGAIRDRAGRPVAYEPAEQILPIDEDLVRYFESPQYQEQVDTAATDARLTFDYQHMIEKKKILIADGVI